MQKPSFSFLLPVFLIFSQSVTVGCNQPQGVVNMVATSDTFPGQTSYAASSQIPQGPVSFVAASRRVTPGVVHIKIKFNGAAAQGASGSGVIISNDGYIATNNHVIENASAIDVILPDKRMFAAKLIGRDPNTDLALLKVNATNLPVVVFGNSDKVEIGEWVLAVGFPLSLNTTVTAGIVSAKARNIGIINRPGRSGNSGSATPQGSSAVESFIQTDAAINSGNSGGALVNTAGELIGINSAIASQTGSYAGYAFAIPVNLAKKILDDLRDFGVVKRGVLGVSFPSPAAEDQYLLQQGLDPASIRGVYITDVQTGSAAAAAGLREGDVIQSINGISLNSSTEFSERIARQKPGDVINITYLRRGATATVAATLKSEAAARPALADANSNETLQEIYNRLGATFAPLNAEIKQRLNLDAGVLVTGVVTNGFFDQAGIPAGTIIAFINGNPINNPKDIDRALLSSQSGLIQVFAIAPDGSKVVFNFSLGT